MEIPVTTNLFLYNPHDDTEKVKIRNFDEFSLFQSSINAIFWYVSSSDKKLIQTFLKK